MPTPLKLLVFAGPGADAAPVALELERRGFVLTSRIVNQSSQFAAELNPTLDLLVVHGQFTAADFRQVFALTRAAVNAPVYVIVPELEEASAEVALELGAADVLTADQLFRLGWLVKRAMAARHVQEEREQAELTLRQSEEQYRNMVEGAMEGLAIHQNGTIRFANRAAARLAGYDHPSELVGRSIWETFVAPEAREELKARCAACLAGQPQPMHAGWPGIRRDGSRAWVQSSVALIAWQGQPAMLGYFTDITERKRAEDLLRASEERFSKAFHGSPLPVSIATLDEGRYIDVNASLAEMVGVSREEIIGKTALELNLWVDLADRNELIRLVAERSVAKSFPTRLRVRSGEIREVLISAESIQLGQAGCMIVVTEDVTEHRRLEEQFRQAQKMEAVGQLAGGVAHDFNNLLTVIQGHAALLKDHDSTPASVRESAEQIAIAAERAASLTRQLLTFSRRQVMQPRSVDLNEVIDRTGKMLRRILGEDIELVLELAPELPAVHADAGMIEQVLLNLAVNSRDAMPRGGRLTIATSAPLISAEMAQRCSDASPGRVVCVRFVDTGCGIAPEHLGRIFEPFFTTKGVGKGTGLGLASAYGIIKQHRGWIEVSSQLNHGTTFLLHFPAITRTGAGS